LIAIRALLAGSSRSDWSKRWTDSARIQPADHKLPGVTLDALKLLHLERRILLHGHEPLDADFTPTLFAEDWLMNNGYVQAEVSQTSIRFPRPERSSRLAFRG